MTTKMLGVVVGVATGAVLGPIAVLLGLVISILVHCARLRTRKQISQREHLQRCLELTELMDEAS